MADNAVLEKRNQDVTAFQSKLNELWMEKFTQWLLPKFVMQDIEGEAFYAECARRSHPHIVQGKDIEGNETFEIATYGVVRLDSGTYEYVAAKLVSDRGVQRAFSSLRRQVLEAIHEVCVVALILPKNQCFSEPRMLEFLQNVDSIPGVLEMTPISSMSADNPPESGRTPRLGTVSYIDMFIRVQVQDVVV